MKLKNKKKINQIVDCLDNINNGIVQAKDLCMELGLEKTYMSITSFQEALKNGEVNLYLDEINNASDVNLSTRSELKKVCRANFKEFTSLAHKYNKISDEFTWVREYKNFLLVFAKDPNYLPDVCVSYHDRKDTYTYLDTFESLASFIKYCKIL